MDSNYDEFGNYLGPVLSSDSESSSSDEEVAKPVSEVAAAPRTASTAIVLHEDKRYYEEAQQVFGVDTETLVQDEDTTLLSDPTIKPAPKSTGLVDEHSSAAASVSDEWLRQLLLLPARLRNVAFVGHLHAGKTALLDLLLGHKHGTRYTDTRVDEQVRGISLKSCGASFVGEDSRGTSFAVHAVDVPGHAVFLDELAVGLHLADGVVLVVDAVEGLLGTGAVHLRKAIQQGLKVTMVINKIDRLVLELRLPPADCYYKLRSIIDSVNIIVAEEWSLKSAEKCPHLLSPTKGNVLFASCLHGWIFSLQTFAATMYSESQAGALAERLWGDVWHTQGNFTRTAPASAVDATRRSFVTFVLEPLYKIYSLVVSSEHDDLVESMRQLRLEISASEARLDVGPLVRLCMSRLLGGGGDKVATNAVFDLVSKHLPSPQQGAANKALSLAANSEGVLCDRIASGTGAEGAHQQLLITVAKCIHRAEDSGAFEAWGRVLSGTLADGARVKVLGEHYTADEEEDSSICTVQGIWISAGRRRIPLESAPPGSIVLIGGISTHIAKTATVTVPESSPDEGVLRPLSHSGSVVKVAVEPVNPSDLPKV